MLVLHSFCVLAFALICIRLRSFFVFLRPTASRTTAFRNFTLTFSRFCCCKWECNKWGLKGCLEIGRNRPFCPFSAFFALFRRVRGNLQKTEERPFPSDILRFPSLKPPFAAPQYAATCRDVFRDCFRHMCWPHVEVKNFATGSIRFPATRLGIGPGWHPPTCKRSEPLLHFKKAPNPKFVQILSRWLVFSVPVRGPEFV